MKKLKIILGLSLIIILIFNLNNKSKYNDRATYIEGIIDKYNRKFIYNDNFGSVVLRNEAIIKFTREDWQKPYYTADVNLCYQLEKLLNIKK